MTDTPDKQISELFKIVRMIDESLGKIAEVIKRLDARVIELETRND